MPMMDRGWWQRDLQLNTPQGGDKICWKDFHVCHTRPELAEQQKVWYFYFVIHFHHKLVYWLVCIMGPTKWTFLPHTQQDFFLLDLTNSIITVSGKSQALLDICGWYFSNRTSLNIKGRGWILSIFDWF